MCMRACRVHWCFKVSLTMYPPLNMFDFRQSNRRIIRTWGVRMWFIIFFIFRRFWMSGNWTFCFLIWTFAFAFGGFSSESCDTSFCFSSSLSGWVRCSSSELDSSSATGCMTCSTVSSGLENIGCCGIGTTTDGIDGGIDGGGCGGYGGCSLGGGSKFGSSISQSLSSSCSPESFPPPSGMFTSSSGGGP